MLAKNDKLLADFFFFTLPFASKKYRGDISDLLALQFSKSDLPSWVSELRVTL